MTLGLYDQSLILNNFGIDCAHVQHVPTRVILTSHTSQNASI